MRAAPALVTAALVAGGIAVTGAPAQADLVTRCIGEGGAVTVPGDLVVPAGRSCTLTGTTVNGNVRVAAGADLVAVDATFNGNVVVQADAYLDAVNTTVSGNVRSRAGYGTYLETTQVGGAYVEEGGDADPFLFTSDASIGKRVDITNGALVLDGTDVSGPVSVAGGDYSDIFDSTLFRTLTVTGMEYGAVFCESEVDGDALYDGNAYGTQIGGGGVLSECDGPSYFGGNLTVSNSTGGVQVSDTIVRGDLGGEGNDPAPTGEGNRVRGEVTGQFVDLQPTPEAAAAQAPSLKAMDKTQARTAAPELAAGEDKKAEIRQDRDERRAQATAEAQAAGKANL
ncbi:hypothetical protein [Thalassiella azotivora]